MMSVVPSARLFVHQWPSPVAELLFTTDHAQRLRSLDFLDHEHRMSRLLQRHYGRIELRPAHAPRSLTDRFEAYFAGDLDALESISCATNGTAFQEKVWNALRSVSPGTTTSYGQIATSIGAAGSARAVGAANGANPIGIVVPCHRVIGKSGTLTGYGGGIERKRWLLEHEQRHSAGATLI
jgi:methylated-DNA-[protein]-cysteine S-methyltransferase